jgi:hypothetical protein
VFLVAHGILHADGPAGAGAAKVVALTVDRPPVLTLTGILRAGNLVGKGDGDPVTAPPGAALPVAPWAGGVAPADGVVLGDGTTLGVGDVLGLDDGDGVAGPVVAVPGVVAFCRGVAVPVGCGATLPTPWFPVTTLPTVVPEPL